MKNKKLYTVLSILIIVLLIILWQVSANRGRINTVIFPSPKEILEALIYQVKSGALWRHITASFRRVMIGYLIGSVLGIALGFMLYTFPRFSALMELPLGFVRPIPSMALFPIFILWLGIGESSKIALIAFVSFWPVLLNTEEGVRQTDANLVELTEVLEKNRLERILTIIIPSTAPYIFSGLRMGISRAWGGVVVAEMLAASSGVGFLIEYSREMSQSHVVFMGVIVIAVIGLLIDILLRKLQQKICYWHKGIK